MSSYDVAVLGSGPGGYVAAIRAAHHGLKTVLIEKDAKLGGTCLLRGCIPTKSLLHSADLLQQLKQAGQHGILAGEVGFDFAAVQKARDKVVVRSAAGVAHLMKQNKVEVLQGRGRFLGPTTLAVEGTAGVQQVEAKNVIIATGSVPKPIRFLSVDHQQIITSDDALTLPQPPESMLILGAGAVGVEFASIYSRFGTRCTLVEMLDRVLPIEDEEVSATLATALKKRGIELHTATRLEHAEVRDGRIEAQLAGEESTTVTAEKLLVAIGRAPYTEGLDLDKAGLATDEGGFIPVNELMQTAAPTVYAIGDIVRTPQLAHIASAEALVAVDRIAGKAVQPLKYAHTPSCTYCDPEVASCGLTEKAARERGYQVKIGKFPFSALAKARILGANEGFVKIVSDAAYDELLGVHIIGPHATDLIAEACVALRLESTTEELARTIHAHPTLPEAVLEAAHGALGRPIHL